MTEAHHLPLLAQTMRERGLNVADITTNDQRFIDGHYSLPASIIIWWNDITEKHHRRTANHLAHPVDQVEHRRAKAHDAARDDNAPRITQPDGSEQVYVVGKGWADAI